MKRIKNTILIKKVYVYQYVKLSCLLKVFMYRKSQWHSFFSRLLSLHALHAPRTFLGSHIGFDFGGVWLHVDMAYPVEFAEVKFLCFDFFSLFIFHPFSSLSFVSAGKHIGFGCGGVWLHIDMAAPVKSVSVLKLIGTVTLWLAPLARSQFWT